jgi:cytochrome c551/c552
MKSLLLVTVTAAGLLVGGAAAASEELAKEQGCVKCHAATEKKKGPSIAQMAADNKGKSADQVIADLKASKHPKIKATDEELKTLVTWMLKS